jgi:hypothetical protein
MEQVFANLGNRELDGFGVFKDGQEEWSGRDERGGADVDFRLPVAMVEAAKLTVAQGGRSATISTHFYVLAKFDGIN